MSDIWHITNKNEKPTDIPEKENFVVLIGHWTSCLWYGGEEPESIFWENVKRWCYLDELIIENERTRKVLKKAKSVLTNLNDYARLDGFQECDVEEALAEITALEQRDIK